MHFLLNRFTKGFYADNVMFMTHMPRIAASIKSVKKLQQYYSVDLDHAKQKIK